jgi:hypothetical protein
MNTSTGGGGGGEVPAVSLNSPPLLPLASTPSQLTAADGSGRQRASSTSSARRVQIAGPGAGGEPTISSTTTASSGSSTTLLAQAQTPPSPSQLSPPLPSLPLPMTTAQFPSSSSSPPSPPSRSKSQSRSRSRSRSKSPGWIDEIAMWRENRTYTPPGGVPSRWWGEGKDAQKDSVEGEASGVGGGRRGWGSEKEKDVAGTTRKKGGVFGATGMGTVVGQVTEEQVEGWRVTREVTYPVLIL